MLLLKLQWSTTDGNKSSVKKQFDNDIMFCDFVAECVTLSGIPWSSIQIYDSFPKSLIRSVNGQEKAINLGINSGKLIEIKEGTPSSCPSVINILTSSPMPNIHLPPPPPLPLPTIQRDWSCPSCTFVNDLSKTRCEICDGLSSRAIIKRRIIAADNSCLFNSIGLLLLNSVRKGQELRQLVKAVVLIEPDIYTEAMLGKQPKEYVAWITNDETWGGEIEATIIFSTIHTDSSYTLLSLSLCLSG